MSQFSRAEWERMIVAQEDGNFEATSMEFVDAYYEAEEVAREDFDEARLGGSDEVLPFMVAALEAAGYEGGGADPRIIFDIEDDSDRSGYVNEAGIHLHPRILDQWVLLHELAHWIDPRPGHNPRWAWIYVELVSAVVGQLAGTALRREFEARELPYHW